MSLVVKKWYADTKPNENGAYVEIYARKPGLLAYCFAMVGIDPTSYIGVFYDKIIIQITSWTGYKKYVVPIESVNFAYFGFVKPKKTAIIIAVAAGILAYKLNMENILYGGLLLSIVYYVLNKEMEFGLVAEKKFSLNSLKRSLIEGEVVNIERLELATKIIVTLIDQHKTKKREQ
jgi:hypothetical protein